MTDERFEALVRKFEDVARNRPRGYKLGVLSLAMLGNAYVGAIVLATGFLFVVLLASIAVLKALAVKLILVVGFFLWMIVKALWVKIDPPAGTEIGARHAPELFAMIDELRRRLRAPRFHHVLVTDDFNAGVVQSPRLGLLGWPRNYLLIGLPLMKSLSVEQFKAVLAHEFGHLAKGHGRLSNWIYRQRLRWARILEALERSGSGGSFLFRPFMNWFVPYFNACSFPMARANEYEADAVSARLTSPRAAAEALTGTSIVGRYLGERYWPQIHRRADDEPTPALAPFLALGEGMAADVDEAASHAWLEQAMGRQTDSADTHPALADRLAAIGEAPRLALPSPDAAADRLLGGALEAITERFDRRWQEAIRPSWEARYREVQEDRRQLAEFDARAAAGDALTVAEAFQRARLTESVAKDAEAALVQFCAVHARAPDDPVVCFGLGARLLEREDEAGCPLIEHAMTLDEEAIAPGCEYLRDFHWRSGRQEEAEAWHRRLAARLELLEAARQERNQVTLRDKFEVHGLPEHVLAELRAQLKRIPGLRKAYLVRKRVRHLAHLPCYVFGYRVTAFYRLHSKRRVEQALQQIQALVRFPGETLIINVEGDNYRFGRKLGWMRGSRVF